MRRLFVFLFLFCATLSMAQVDLTVLPKAERDSALVAIVQGLILQKFPENIARIYIPSFQNRMLTRGWSGYTMMVCLRNIISIRTM